MFFLQNRHKGQERKRPSIYLAPKQSDSSLKQQQQQKRWAFTDNVQVNSGNQGCITVKQKSE